MKVAQSNDLMAWAAVASISAVGWLACPVPAAEYGTPRPLLVGDTFRIDVDGFINGAIEGYTEPRNDANNGSCIAPGQCDNPYFQRNNVTAAHVGGCTANYWYTRSKATAPGEADPCGPQWVDYKPPLAVLGPGRYAIHCEYRNTASRATYPAQYIVHHADGVSTILKSQRDGTSGDCISFDLGAFNLAGSGYVRVNDTGCLSLTFNKMRFTYLGPSGGANSAPAVNAGADQTIVLPSFLSLHAVVTDDGLPSPPGAVACVWSKIGGPGTVTFANAAAPVTSASFSAAGSYILRLTAHDGEIQSSDDVAIVVLAAGSPLTYSTQYEFDAAPDTAIGVIDADTDDVNGDGRLTKVGNGFGRGPGAGIAAGILHYVDNDSSSNDGWYFQNAGADLSFTVDMRVKANNTVTGSLQRRSMGFSAGPNKNLGLRLHQPNEGSGVNCVSGSVHFNNANGGSGPEGCVTLTGFHRLRLSVNAASNTLRVFDLESGVIVTQTGGGAPGTTPGWANQISNLGGFHIGSISAANTTATDYEVDYFRLLLGIAVEDASTVIQPVLNCGSVFADRDGDLDVDLDDFGALQRCYTGRQVDPPSLPPECRCLDRNSDNLIEDADLDAFRRCVSGPGIQWNLSLTPACQP